MPMSNRFVMFGADGVGLSTAENLTGLSNMAVELARKRIELAKEMIKDLSRVALLVNTADEIGSRAYIAEGDAAGPRLSLTVVAFGVRDANDLEGAISKISTGNFQAIVVTHDGLFYVQRKRLADLALEKRLPTIGFASEQWKPGCLQPMDRTCLPCTDAQARSSTRSSKGQTPPIFLLSNPRNLSFLSTTGPLRRLV